MNPCDYLARVGYGLLVPHPAEPDMGGDDPDWVADNDPERYAAAVVTALRKDHESVMVRLRDSEAEPVHHYVGARWLGTLITWPDRMPCLKTWAGQMTLPGIIKKSRAAIRGHTDEDPFAFSAPLKGVTGFDPLPAQSALDIGFNPARLDMPIFQRPAVELLAVYGLESLPLVSFGRRDCGFVHGGRLWRFAVEERDGWLHRWGMMRDDTAARMASAD
jgi:hypothetical protein